MADSGQGSYNAAVLTKYFDAVAHRRDFWIERNRYFYDADNAYMRFLVPEGARVLEIGCATGQLLAALNPKHGVGLDISPRMIETAKANFPQFEFHVGDAEDPDVYKTLGGPFDYVILSDTIGLFGDCETALEALRAVCDRDTRLIVAYYNHLWDPALRFGDLVGEKMPLPEPNWLPSDTIAGLLGLAGFEVVAREWRILLPKFLLGLGPLINRTLGALPVIRKFGLRKYLVARPLFNEPPQQLSASVIIPCRNESGNIEPAIERLPRFATDMEIIFVEGHSEDGTLEACQAAREKFAGWDIKVMAQDGKGKGQAVRQGFAAARGDVLMILDADLTVAPEDLPRFYKVIANGSGEFVNGTRLVYPMEDKAMRFLNMCANWTFSRLFTYMLNQRYTDTLCGTKVLRREHYEKIAANRDYFGDFDPFGDFDLIFGAGRLGLRTVEIPIRYRSRAYGETQISRFRHGWLLLRMVAFAFRKLKAI